MHFKKNVAIVVDAYVTGAFLAPALLANGITCIHVRSQATIRDAVRAFFRSGDFIHETLYADDESLLRELASYKVQWVFAGCEMAVRLAAHLAELFDLSARNDAAHSARWRDKYVMHQALKEAGVRSLRDLRSRDVEEVFAWKREMLLDYPVVLKPIDSSGSDNVHICENEAQVRQAFQQVISSPNTMLRPNTEVLAQEFLRNNELIQGADTQHAGAHQSGADVEYCVNTVSHAGRHFVSEIIKVHRTRVDGLSVHDYNELLCPVVDAGIYEVFSGYVFSVLDALGIEYGPCHSELMVVGEQPVLLESAARLPGGIDLSAYTKALGHNQLMLWIQSCLNPQAFHDYCARARLPLNCQSSCVFLVSDIEGDIVRMPDIGGWLRLPSFHSTSIKDNGRLTRTTALTNYPGYVFLLAPDKRQLALDRARLRSEEKLIYRAMTGGAS